MQQIDLIGETLRDLGYKALVEEIAIRSGVGGFQCTLIYFEGSGTIQVYMPFGKHGFPEVTLEDINKANSSVKFARTYLKEDVIAIEQDFLIDPNRPELPIELRKLMVIWESAVADVVKVLRVAGKTAEAAGG